MVALSACTAVQRDTTMECNYSIHNRAAVPQECCLTRCMLFANSSSWKVPNKCFEHVHVFRSLLPPSFLPVVRQLCCPATHELIPVHRIGRALRVTLTSSGSGTAAKHLRQAGFYISEEPSARLPTSLNMPRRSGMQSTHRWWRMWWCTAPGRGPPDSVLGPCRGMRLPGR